MPGVARQGDGLGIGGILTLPSSSTVTVNDISVALQGCIYTPHLGCSPRRPQHCFGSTVGISYGVTIEDQVPLTLGSIGTCGHPVVSCSLDVSLG
jgi:hypothetical protein